MYAPELENLEKFIYADKTYINWYEDDTMRIGFSDIPDIDEKIINTSVMNKTEIKASKKKPFVLNNVITVILLDKTKNITYIFSIDAGYSYDGATIPKLLWPLIGSKGDVRFKIAALIHDVTCENKHFVGNDRYFADKVFERCCYVGGTCAFVRWLMFHTVDNFQKTQGW